MPQAIVDDQGNAFMVRVFASAVDPGSWAGWLQFRLAALGRPTVSTGQEIVHGSLGAVALWAAHLDPDYVRGALDRALRRSGRKTKPVPRLVGAPVPVRDKAGEHFEARAFVQSSGHLWVAWIEFEPEGDLGPVLVTHHETSQPSLGAAIAWVMGLDAGYFDRALQRGRLWSCPPTAGHVEETPVPRRWPHERH
jgi:hypothetical protein